MKSILITGTAGFIGHHLAKKLQHSGNKIVGIDCINNYYDINLKFDRLKNQGYNIDELKPDKLIQNQIDKNHYFIQANLESNEFLQSLFEEHAFDIVVNLAAQAGVRYSISNPQAYINSNIQAFINILEGCRNYNVGHLVFASSSSVYGLNSAYPFKESVHTDHPISLYAATKKANELMAHSYAHLYNLPCTGLRFFTSYGPWGRPDMALYIFTKNILENKPIEVYNNGEMLRDFTYVEDIVGGIISTMHSPAKASAQYNSENPNPSISSAPYTLYNIGNNAPINLMDFVHAIEKKLNKKAIIKLMPIQAGDVKATYADSSKLEKDFNYKPSISIEEGINAFVDWYMEYYKK